MRFKDLKNTEKIIAKLPGPWVPGYWAMMRGTQKRKERLHAVNQSQDAKK